MQVNGYATAVLPQAGVHREAIGWHDRRRGRDVPVSICQAALRNGTTRTAATGAYEQTARNHHREYDSWFQGTLSHFAAEILGEKA